MKRAFFVVALFLTCACALFAEDKITLVRPLDKAVVSPLRAIQQIVLRMSMEQQEELWQDSRLLDQLPTDTNGSMPAGIAFRFKFDGDREKVKFQVFLGDNPELTDARILANMSRNFNLQNLEPGKTYYWKVQSLSRADKSITAESAVHSFTVEDCGWRVMYVPDMWNVRDLGGKQVMNGLRIPYGRVYRSGGLNNNSSDGGKTPGKCVLTKEGQEVVRNGMKLRCEVDLRSDVETAKMTESPAGPEVKYIHAAVGAYADYLYSEKGMAVYRDMLRNFADPENYPLIFHCIAGADRTGTTAFLLEALVGCSRDDIRLDYVLTSFHDIRRFNRVDELLAGLGKYGEAEEPLQYKAERFLLACGLTKEEILAIQRNILGTDAFPVSPVLK